MESTPTSGAGGVVRQPTDAPVVDDRQPSGGPLRAVGVAVGLLVLGLLASIAFGVLGVLATIPLGWDVESTAATVTLLAASQVGFLAVGYWYVTRYLDGVPDRVPTRRDLTWIGGGIVVAVVAAIALLALVDATVGMPGYVAEAESGSATYLVALAVLSLVLVAPAEELLFRGAIQGRLGRAFGVAGSVLGGSLLFATIHLANFTGPLLPVVAAAAVVGAVSLVFGYAYERTGNLVVPVLVHGCYNALLAGLSLFAL